MANKPSLSSDSISFTLAWGDGVRVEYNGLTDDMLFYDGQGNMAAIGKGDVIAIVCICTRKDIRNATRS